MGYANAVRSPRISLSLQPREGVPGMQEELRKLDFEAEKKEESLSLNLRCKPLPFEVGLELQLQTCAQARTV